MALRLVTGKTGENVTAAQDAALYAGLAGLETSILPIGEKMRASKISNNSIRVYDGCVIDQGRLYMIDPNTYQNYTIDSGSQGVVRYDIIGLQYSKSGTGDESVSTFVKKNAGENGTVTRNSLWDGASTTQVGLYRIKMNGLAIESITPMCKTFANLDNILWTDQKTIEDNGWTIRYQKSGYCRALIQIYKTLQAADTPLSNQIACYVPSSLKPVNTQYLTVRTVGNTGTLHGMGTAELKSTDKGLYLFCEKSNYQAEYIAYGEILLAEDLGDE